LEWPILESPGIDPSCGERYGVRGDAKILDFAETTGYSSPLLRGGWEGCQYVPIPKDPP